VTDPSVGTTSFAWLKTMPVVPKADHIRELLDRLQHVRGIGLPVGAAEGMHEARLRQFVREGYASDAFETVDEAVGWAKLLRVRGEVTALADLADEDPLLRAAGRWRTLPKFAADLIAALEFRALQANDPILAALRLLVDLNNTGRREMPPDAPMPFRKAWRRLVMADGTPDRRLYETAVLATLRDRLRSGDVWVERSSGYRRCCLPKQCRPLLPAEAVPAAATELGLPASADAWLSARGAERHNRARPCASLAST
jgi:hypothetical protein